MSYNSALQRAAPANVRLIDLAAENNVQAAIAAILSFWDIPNPTDKERAIARGYALAALAGLSTA